MLSAAAFLEVRGAWAQMPATSVVVTQAEERELPATLTLVGTVAPLRRSIVCSAVQGRALEVPVRQGDRVVEGDVLCRLDPEVMLLRLAQEKAKLGRLEAAHEELVAGTRKEEITRLEALKKEAEARQRRWVFELQRVQKLFNKEDAGSARELRDAEWEKEAADQLLIAATAAYNLAVEGPRKEQIRQAAFEVAAQKAMAAEIEAELRRMEIRAPFDGFVSRRMVEVGEWVNEGGQVVELLDLSRVLVEVGVPESGLPYIQEGDEARVMLDALPGAISGRVRHVMRQADLSARTFPVEMEVPNPDSKISAGMFARVDVTAGPRNKVAAVPKDAVIERDQVFYVTVVAPGEGGSMMGMPVAVKLGAEADDWVAITSGNVAPGSSVAVRGNERIMFPSPVVVVDEYGRPVEATNGAESPTKG